MIGSIPIFQYVYHTIPPQR